ncbi:beta-propeller domain-containing protein [Bacillus coahuilensis]|nr:beta-propeller domain-containing protein [Bacillus coahuilensis]
MKGIWWWTLGLVMISVCILGALYLVVKPATIIESNRNPIAITTGEPTVVLNDKVWTIRFSKEIDSSTITNETIHVQDKNGDTVDVTLEIAEDRKSVQVLPPTTGYDTTLSPYELNVSTIIEGSNGWNTRNSPTLSFVTVPTLPLIESDQELKKYFTSITKQMKEEKRSLWGEETLETAESNEQSADSSALKQSSNDYSETNTQVSGVDESDHVKTDGNYLYRVQENQVVIFDIRDRENLRIVSEIQEDPNFQPGELYLNGDQLIVTGYKWDEENTVKARDEIYHYFPWHSYSSIKIYDIKDRNKPTLLRDIALEGHQLSSRKVDSTLYIVSSYYPDLYYYEENMNVELRPLFSDSKIGSEPQPVQFDSIRYVPESQQPNFITIMAIDLINMDTPVATHSYLGGGEQLYMSKENLYVAVSNYQNIREPSSWSTIDSEIYKFHIDGTDVTYTSMTHVDGTILNQFSMDEYKGNFRVVTTTGFAWDETSPSANHLYIFDQNLQPLSSIEDLAKGERIYSARFMGDKAYMVTFRETDPLFVMDTSDPMNPKVLGELKIPGFSNYLHPYDENHLIGFGYDTTLETIEGSKEPIVRQGGMKISLFDITDFSNPIEKDTLVIGGRGTYSELQYNHKALMHHPSHDLFAFPISIYEPVKGSQYEDQLEFQGGLVYTITPKEGIQKEAEIIHVEGELFQYGEWETEMQRFLYVGDTLLALSNNKLSTHDINTYSILDELEF